jgi:hypothetical protein
MRPRVVKQKNMVMSPAGIGTRITVLARISNDLDEFQPSVRMSGHCPGTFKVGKFFCSPLPQIECVTVFRFLVSLLFLQPSES